MGTDVLTEAMTHIPSTAPIQPGHPLPLEPGDRLTRAEFERRYDAMPEVKKAELIEGVVYMTSPVRYKSHGKPHSDIHGWLFNYSVATAGVELADNVTLRLDADNDPQPDLILRIDESRVFPGLRLNLGAMLNGDLAKVLMDLQEGIESEQHAAFIKQVESLGQRP